MRLRDLLYECEQEKSTKRRVEDGREILLNVGKVATIFNKYEEKKMEDYNIDYSFYIAEANKIKNAVYCGQLKLF